jgi:rhodanese-related sulfurtransferase
MEIPMGQQRRDSTLGQALRMINQSLHSNPTRQRPRRHRNQPFSPSPSKSPAGAVFPFKSPSATPPNPPSLGTLPPAAFGGGVGGMPSPWLALAASSGAPTPSLDGPGRNSPQLGSPFEKLNIGGSWSGANLSDPLAGRRASLEPPSFSLSASPGKSSLSTEFSFGGAMDGQKSKSMDNSKKDRDQDMAIDAPEPKQKPALPATLAARRASLPRNHVNVHGPVISKANSPLALSNITDAKPSTAQKAQPLAASSLGPMIANPNVLILDLRPPSSYQAAHLPRSHSLPIPSTLLRRPAFTVEKLVAMLHGDSMQAVSQWRNKTDIVLIDQDSQYVSAGHILDGLASKFAREGYTGNIWFIKGGHGAVRAAGLGLIQSGEEEPSTPQIPGYTGPGGAGLMAGGMGRMAFQNSKLMSLLSFAALMSGSTGGGGMLSPSTTMSGGSRTPGLQLRLDPFDQQTTTQRGSPTTSKKSSSYRGHSAMGDESTASTLQPANPFFDNIRQNMELSHGGITDRIPLGLPEEIKSRASELPSFLEPLATMSDKDASDVLARQFYQVELGEQKRLQAVMDWHTQDSGAMTNEKQAHQDRGQRSADREEVQRLASWGAAQLAGQQSPDEADGGEYYPFSITAGVERGTKNRYKNIWPYDFSRVRLGSPEDDSDYINASYIQPRGTSRRYIATQGPMDATYRDFWTLVWEQGVQVIAM